MASTVEQLEARCLTNGVVLRKTLGDGKFSVIHAPMTLQPTVVPAQGFHQVCDLMPTWNKLIDRVSRDHDFLMQQLASTAASDKDFTGRLYNMYAKLYSPESTSKMQQTMLGIFRADYMRSVNSTDSFVATGERSPYATEWKNVEINTISCSFAALSTRVGQVHRFLELHRGERKSKVSVSESETNVPRALAAAHSYWINHTGGEASAATTTIVMVVQENERNTGDQYLLIFKLLEAHGVRTVRKTLTELSKELQLDEAGNATIPVPTDLAGAFAGAPRLFVSLFYFRSTYTPTDFISEATWEAREAIERSSAVKCPSLPYHLCTTKRIQQALSHYGALRKYCDSDRECRALFATFMGQYTLDTATNAHVVTDAVEHPEKYVLKPQLEGGGNLISGAEMQRQLNVSRAADPALYDKVHQEYILMERIVSQTSVGGVMKEGVPHHFNALVGELGVFGCVLSTGSTVVLNELSGYLMRTKPENVIDGGVMSGLAALDSVSLFW